MKRQHDEITGSDDMDVEEYQSSKRQKASRTCPYLDTVDRNRLDFDFEKQCSVSLMMTNIYACLVCGKYFQGRGVNTHAYTHSLQCGHHVFINTHTKKCYCLPDNYEIIDSSLDDVKNFLDPQLTKEEIENLDTKPIISRTLDGREYICGVVGLNNINKNAHINTVIQALAHLPTFRNFWLDAKNYSSDAARPPSELVARFGVLIRKIWNPHNYRSHVTPHEFLQEVTKRSDKKFRSGLSGDPIDFLSWLLNTLHKDMTTVPVTADMTPEQAIAAKKKAKKDVKRPSAITEAFQGRVRIIAEKEIKERKKKAVPEQPKSQSAEERDSADSDEPPAPTVIKPEPEEPKTIYETRIIRTETELPFYYLSLEVPSMPLFKDEQERNIIPQRPLFDLLAKFDGKTTTFVPQLGESRRMTITQLPKYLILHIKRFSKNVFFTEKNKTIITFPIKNLDLKDYVTLPPGTQCSTRYDLIANIRHEGTVEDGSFSVHIFHKANSKWYNIHDLIVEETMQELVPVSEAYIQIYERQS